MKRCSVKPYEGNEKYIFISYCHKDKAQVFPIIEQLAKDGFRVWYDEGIAPGEDWPEVIAEHLNACTSCIAFVSNNSISSHNCKKEINYAFFLNKFFVSVFLEPVEMTLGMQMQLSTNQSVLKYTIDSEREFFTKLYAAKELKGCLGRPNPDIVVSKPSDYSQKDIAMEKARNPFSNSWFTKRTEAKAAETKPASKDTNTAELTSIKEKVAQLLKLIKEKEDAACQLTQKNEVLQADIQSKKAADEKARAGAEDEIKKAEKEAKLLAEKLLRQKEVVAQLKSAEEERVKAVKEREIKEKDKQDSLNQKLESVKKEKQELLVLFKEAQSKLEALKAQAAERSAEAQEKEIQNETEQSETCFKTIAQNVIQTTEFVLKRERTGQVINILVGSHIIGRSTTQAKYCIDDNKTVGRAHATVIADKGEVVIIDNNSLNKTCINGKVLEPNVKYLLRDGDVLKIADERFLFTKGSKLV